MARKASGHDEVKNVPSRNPIAQSVSTTEAQHTVPLQIFIKDKASNDEAYYEVSAKLIFPINYHSDIPYLEKIYNVKRLQILFACAQVYWSR